MEISATKEELEAGRGYEALFVPALFKPWTGHVLEGAGVKNGDHVLDIACGSGVLTRKALEQVGDGGRIVGLDPAAGMLAAAQEIEPEIEWVQGAAEDLPFNDASFDCVVSQFGMMFFRDRAKAAAEMHRVLKPGGRLAVALWSAVAENPAYREIVAVLDETVSTEAGDAVRLPFSLGEAALTVATFANAGFDAVSYEVKTEQACFPSPRTMVEAEVRGWLPLFGITLDEDKITDVLARADFKLAEFATATGEAVFPTSGYIVTATKPSG